jgi:hypothetical protein
MGIPEVLSVPMNATTGVKQMAPPIEGLMERYYKKKYFSMNIFEMSLTKPFDWNKNYTKPAKI